MAEEKKVTIKAKTVLRDETGKVIPVGATLSVPEATATILVKNAQAELVKIQGARND